MVWGSLYLGPLFFVEFRGMGVEHHRLHSEFLGVLYPVDLLDLALLSPCHDFHNVTTKSPLREQNASNKRKYQHAISPSTTPLTEETIISRKDKMFLGPKQSHPTNKKQRRVSDLTIDDGIGRRRHCFMTIISLSCCGMQGIRDG